MKRCLPGIALLILLCLAGCEKNNDNDVVLRLYGDAYEDIAYSLALTDADILIAGVRTVLTRRDGNYIESSVRKMGVFRTGPSGLQKWESNPGSGSTGEAYRVLALQGGDILVAGFTVRGSGTNATTDINIVKLSAAGSVLWESVIGGPGNQYATGVVPRPGGGYMVAGVTDAYRAPGGGFAENIAGMKDFFILEISEDGDSVSSNAFGYGGNDICTQIKHDVVGGYVLYGTTDNSSEPGLDKNNLLIIRLNEDSSNRGAAIIGDLEDEYAADFEVLTDGYLLAATVGKGNENTKIKIIRLTNSIQAPPRFSKTFAVKGLPSAVNALSVAGNVYYLGGRVGLPSSSDMLVLKIDSEGEPSGEPFISGGTGSQEIFDLLISDLGLIYAVGKTGYENNTMMCLLKFRY
jgi:hypothetical protein